ncbi:MAG: PAS domain S-box protein [Nitrospiraceae bacterium]|nr:PAS domain S-box protein [Nitrospiraceae bacterium]
MLPKQRPDKIPLYLLIVFTILIVIIITGGYFYYTYQKEKIKDSREDQLLAIADLKVSEINSWRREIINYGEIISRTPFIALYIDKFLNQGAETSAENEILEWLHSIKEQYKFMSVMLVDIKGNVKFSTESKIIGSHAKQLIKKSIHTNNVLLSDFHKITEIEHIHLDLAVPLLKSAQGEKVASGVLLVRVDPYDFLYPLIQSWPTQSDTAETLLVRREGDNVLFLNELRHKTDTALNLKKPITKTELPAVQAVLGETGIIEGRDYRDASVLAAIRPVPETPWFLVAKVDTEEIYAPIRDRAWDTVFFMLLLIAASGLAVISWWKQKNAEHYRQEYETELRHQIMKKKDECLTKYANDIIMLADSDLTIVDANDRALQVYGYTYEEMLSLKALDLRTEDVRQEVYEKIKESEGTDGLIYETLHKKKDGTVFPIEVSNRVIDIEGNKFFLAIIRDITERKESEKRAKEISIERDNLLLRLQLILERMPVGCIINDKDFNIIYWSPAAEKIFGFTKEEILGKSPFSLFIPLSVKEYVENIRTRMKSGDLTAHGFNENITKDGRTIWCEWYNTPLRDPDGNFTGYMSMVVDATEKRKIEEQLLHSQKLDAIGQLAGGVAHDFNNILTAIIGYASITDMKMQDNDPLKENIKHIIESSRKASSLVKNLLVFGRKQTMSVNNVDINQIIKDIEKLFPMMIGEDIEFKTFLAEKKLIVKADETQIEQVLINLATNAKDAMPNGGNLTITTDVFNVDDEFVRMYNFWEKGLYARITFSDSGAGIDEKIKERIFEPFFTTKEVGKGTGLGLSIAYGIVKQHNGHINVYSHLGEGTTFKIYLPLVQGDEKEERAQMTEEPIGGTETILVIEDEKDVRVVTKTILEAYGYKVIEAADGEDALVKFKDNIGVIDMIICDLIMPKMNGKEVFEKINNIRPGIKALFVSGYSENIMLKKGNFEQGLNFASKPILPVELLKKVREILDK